jgi:hypothetical protein
VLFLIYGNLLLQNLKILDIMQALERPVLLKAGIVGKQNSKIRGKTSFLSRYFECLDSGGCSKTSVFGTASLDLIEKPGFWPVFRRACPKLTEFWNKLSGEKEHLRDLAQLLLDTQERATERLRLLTGG